MPTNLINAAHVRVDYPQRTVLDDVTLGVADGDRIGIVGENGSGKSTLLALLDGTNQPDSGQVALRRGLRVGALPQQVSFPAGQTVRGAIVGDRPEHEWAGDAGIRSVLAGLVPDLAQDAPVASLSGGQRRRVALAALLVGDWDVLALDEPTNHLDLDAITWLAAHLRRRWPARSGALLLITHDRWFLDEVCTRMWEVHDGGVEPFEGGYSAYILQRVERARLAAQAEAKRQNLLRRELAWLGRGARARSSKPRFHLDAVRELVADVPLLRDEVELQRLAVSRLGKDVIDLLDAGVRRGERDVLREVAWRLAPGERAGILGRNGAGKSTLLGLLSGELSATDGRVKRGKTVQVGVLSQEFHDFDDTPDARVRDAVATAEREYQVDGRELTPEELLRQLGFDDALLSERIGDLSGGQRRRLQLFLTLLRQPNVLLLDEPTNDLDTDMLGAVETVLDGWPGTLVVVSHDRYFLERVTDRLYAVIGGRFRDLPGGVDEYLRLEAAAATSGEAAADDVLAGAGVGRSGAQSGRPGAGARGSDTGAADAGAEDAEAASSGLTGADRRAEEKAVAAIERRLPKLRAQLADLDAELAAADQSDFAALSALAERRQALSDDLDAAETEWLERSERLEA
jgi:ATPase subunit of ABC transporter with duplicated ATPase domains